MSEKETPVVTLIADPFGIKTLEVAEAQRKSEDSELDSLDGSESEGILENPVDSDLQETSPQAEVEHLSDLASEWEIDANSEFPAETSSDAEPEKAAEESDSVDLAELDSGVTDSQDFQDSEIQLQNLARAIQEAQQQQEQESTETLTQGPSEQELADRLAREIAEDQLLAQHLAEDIEVAVESAAGSSHTPSFAGDAENSSETSEDADLRAALPQTLDLDEMQSCIETLLFMTDKPLSVSKLHDLLGPELPHSLFQEAVTALRDQYSQSRHGIEIVEIAGGLQFRTKPGRAALAKKLSKVQTQRLSSGAMETLAIVAYRQPVMKEDVDKIRGVDSSYFVRQLLDRKLIQIAGRSELPGRPIVYSTTDDFLQLFGLRDLQGMPSLREIEQMIPSSQSTNPDDEDPRIREMRKLVDQMKSDSSTQLTYDPREDDTILRQIREKVNSIPTSTPYLEEQKALEKQAKELLETQAREAALQAVQPELVAIPLPAAEALATPTPV